VIAKRIILSGGPAFLGATPKGMIFKAAGKPENLGCPEVGSELSRILYPEKEGVNVPETPLPENPLQLMVSPDVKGGTMNEKILTERLSESMSALILNGLEGSREILAKNGVSIVEWAKMNFDEMDLPKINTRRELANYASDRIKNPLFCLSGLVDRTCKIVHDLKVQVYSLRAAEIVGQKPITVSIISELKKLKEQTFLAPCEEMFTHQKKIDDVLLKLEHLTVMKRAKTSGRSVSVVDLSHEFSAMLEKLEIFDPKKISNIAEELKKTGEIIESGKDLTSDKVNKALDESFEILDKNINGIKLSVDQMSERINELVKLSADYSGKKLTREEEAKAFPKELPEKKVADVRLPAISREMAGDATILVVDDDDAVRSLVECSLKNIGVNVESASNGEEALAMINAREEKYDAIITDYNMPKKNGVQLTIDVRCKNKETPIYILTGTPLETGPKEMQRTIELGLAQLIAKGTNSLPQILAAAIRIAQVKAGIAPAEEAKPEKAIIEPEAKELEPELSPLQKLIRVISHKLNNQLTLLNIAALLRSNEDPDGEHYVSTVEKIKTAIEMLSRSIAMLENFAKGSSRLYRPAWMGGLGKLSAMDLLKDLPDDVKNDPEQRSKKNMEELCAAKDLGSIQKLYEAAAILAVLYSPVLAMAAQHYENLKKKYDKSDADIILNFMILLNGFNRAIPKIPEGKRTLTATIDHLIR
jgi:CheY-like chemotaxis protein